MNELREREDISTGELLGGRYRLQERVGEGGMARVYRADDTMLGRTVAVKILRGPVDGLGSIERARSETMVLASLNHHGLVTLFDAHVSADDDSYLVMEFVEGITLQERIYRGALTSAEVASIAVDVADALHAAHSAGIVHRDIKPSNVLLMRSSLPGHEWRAKIADFGIACLQDSARLTSPGIMVGTVAYVAPEQARGAAPAPPADIYSLGLVLIEALTGTRPFAEAEGIGAVVARLQGPPPIPDDLDEEWQHLLRGMTATLPADRPNALEVAVAAALLASRSAVGASMIGKVDTPTAFVPDSTTGGMTAVLPAAAPAALASSSAEPRRASAESSSRRARIRRRRHGGLLGGVVLALLVAASIFGAVIWGSTPSGGPFQPADQMVMEPSIAPTPADDAVPVEDAGDDANSPQPVSGTVDGGADSGSGNANTGAVSANTGAGSANTGAGSANSGPGNNNGGGNGNSGPGNNNGGGNGNGNGKSGKD